MFIYEWFVGFQDILNNKQVIFNYLIERFANEDILRAREHEDSA